MNKLLLVVIFSYAAAQTGLNIKEVLDCKNKSCINRLDTKIENVLKVNWKPISVFPEEAQRFR